jgi:hypothetical protein
LPSRFRAMSISSACVPAWKVRSRVSMALAG